MKTKFNITDIHRVGVDLAKNVIQIYAVDKDNKKLMNRRFTRAKALSFFETLAPCEVGIEACGGAHHWGRVLTLNGHQVKMMPAQYVKPFVKTNKNDAADARAIVEAMDRPDMRFVQVKTTDQQTVLLAHGVREQLIKQRTQTVNALRSHLAEFGVIYPKGIQHVNRICELVRERQEPEVPRFAYRLLDLLVDQIESLDKSIIAAERDINEFFKRSEACQRLAEIPGIGVLTATALVATIGDARQFQGGRHLAAYLGLVPKQHSSGEKTVLRGISKRGNKYLRKLLIHGARSLCQKRKLESGKMPLKLKRLLGERQKPTNVAAVAMANTNARIVWVLLYYGGRYVPNHVSVRGVHNAMAL